MPVLPTTQVTLFSLVSNALTTITVQSLVNGANLQLLAVTGNHITTIEAGALSPMKQTGALFLNQNELSVLAPSV
jgi:hypothetical protein